LEYGEVEGGTALCISSLEGGPCSGQKYGTNPLGARAQQATLACMQTFGVAHGMLMERTEMQVRHDVVDA
jgi:hypothetical protein